MRGREFPRASRSRRWAIIAPYTDRRAITASPSCPSARWRTSRRACPARRWRRPCPLSGSGGDRREGRGAGRLDLCPQRQSLARAKFDYKLAWLERLRAACQKAAGERRAGGADGRLQHHPRRQGCCRSQGLDEGRAVPAGIQGGAAADRKSGLHRRLPRPASRRRALHLLGLLSAPGSATTASASTISCCRPRRWTG